MPVSLNGKHSLFALFLLCLDHFRGVIDYILWRGKDVVLMNYSVLGTDKELYKLVRNEDYESLQGS